LCDPDALRYLDGIAAVEDLQMRVDVFDGALRRITSDAVDGQTAEHGLRHDERNESQSQHTSACSPRAVDNPTKRGA
jgi:hypothetical protein